ncbi:MAG: Tol-Pal system beta propeller repeat protein TolB [Candidatus Hydrogenedentes bacterium]|nr:Tol-Pal system beta propeller repeat protein TolB [Candidatus Hydrogenedentota bacterium]
MSWNRASIPTLAVLLSLLAFAPHVFAQQPVGLSVQKSVDKRVLLAVPTLATVPGQEALGSQMAEVIANDLSFSGLFRILPPTQYPAGFTGLTSDPKQINFQLWQGTPALYLVYGYVSAEQGNIVAQCFLFDIRAANYVVGKKLTSTQDAWRLVAHEFSDEVVKFIDGTPGVATSRICFSGGEPRKKEIYVADYDGANLRQVTKHGSVSILPAFSPDGNKIAYVSYKDRYQYIYVVELATGKSTPLSREVGMNSAPVWHPNGRQLALVLSKDANSEIYMVNSDGTGKRRLTNDKSVDSSPAFSPDGSQIAFVSDRGGKPQIYAMDSSGGNVRRLSTQPGKFYDPVWSPDGKSIAYVLENSEGFEIWMMGADGSSPKQLTSSPGGNENPTWSADSRHVMFASTRTGRSQLWTATISSGENRAVPGITVGAQGPDWGPRR